MVDEFKKALDSGWRPTMEDGSEEYSIRDDVPVTWLPTKGISIVPTNNGTLVLDEFDLEQAKAYNLRSNYA